MKRCKNCVYQTSGVNFRYCMFYRLPNCPGDDGRPVVEEKEFIEHVEERGIEIPKPYPRAKADFRTDRYFKEHDKIFNLFYNEGFTYSEIADEIEGAKAKGVRAYIMKCEAYHDVERRTKRI